MISETRNTTPVDKLTPETARVDPRVFTTYQEFLDEAERERWPDVAA
jgi:hypothetical protein